VRARDARRVLGIGVVEKIAPWTGLTLRASGPAALQHSQIIDLTTTGRRTGQPRRIEIFLHCDDEQLFITGMPRADRTRDLIYNVEADPHVVIHLKQSAVLDVPATARVVNDPDERRPYIEAAARRWRRHTAASPRRSCRACIAKARAEGPHDPRFRCARS